MLSKNPVDVLKEKLDDEEVVEAVRLAVIAELDAINLYLQQARRIHDEKVRSVFLDIAKEEKTHVGEFLAVLEMLDEEQISELKKGFQEVAELTGYEAKLEPNLESDGNGFEKDLEDKVKHFAAEARTFRKKLHVVSMGPTAQVFRVDRLPAEGIFRAVESEFRTFEELAVEFRLSEVDYQALKEDKNIDLSVIAAAAESLAVAEDKFISAQLRDQAGLKVKLDEWEKPGDGLKNLMKAVSEISSRGIPGPYTCFMSPELYSRLLGVVDGNRLEVSILKEAMDIVVTPTVSTAFVVAVAPQNLDVVIGADTEVDYMGQEDGEHVFRIHETLGVRIKRPEGVCLLE